LPTDERFRPIRASKMCIYKEATMMHILTVPNIIGLAVQSVLAGDWHNPSEIAAIYYFLRTRPYFDIEEIDGLKCFTLKKDAAIPPSMVKIIEFLKNDNEIKSLNFYADVLPSKVYHLELLRERNKLGEMVVYSIEELYKKN